MILKKITSVVTATLFIIATTGCSTNQMNSSGGSKGSGASQVAGSETNMGKQILGYALGFAIGAALAKSLKKDD